MVMSCPTGAADQAEEGPIEASDCCGVGWRQAQSFNLSRSGLILFCARLSEGRTGKMRSAGSACRPLHHRTSRSRPRTVPFQSGRNWRHRAPGKLKRGLKLLQSRESRSFQLVNCNEVMVGGSCFLCEVAAYDEELVGVIYIYIHIHTYIYYIYMYIYIYVPDTFRDYSPGVFIMHKLKLRFNVTSGFKLIEQFHAEKFACPL